MVEFLVGLVLLLPVIIGVAVGSRTYIEDLRQDLLRLAALVLALSALVTVLEVCLIALPALELQVSRVPATDQLVEQIMRSVWTFLSFTANLMLLMIYNAGVSFSAASLAAAVKLM